MGHRDAAPSRRLQGHSKGSRSSYSRSAATFEVLETRRLLSSSSTHGGGCGCPFCAAATKAANETEPLPPTQVVVNQLARAGGGSATWQPLSALPAARGKQSYLSLNAYTPFAINATQLRNTLAKAPLEFTAAARNQPLVMTLPTPDGTLQSFRVEEAPVLAPELAAQFPDIKTYRAFGIDDPYATARLDFTLQGFHAQVISPGRTFYIDPYYHLDQSAYVSYYRTDAVNTHLDFRCLTVSPEDPGPALEGGPEAAVGSELRTYRTAVSATGEYTAFHGGTVPLGLSAVTTVINRVTGVYEVDFAVRLQLIANNNTLIFTNSATDPFTNVNDPITSNNQNQAYVDANIGSANYDVGHVFHNGFGGGMAGGIGIVGVAGQKAKGYSSVFGAVGDPFSIDYVAHEMGHQFGGRHTFNNCNNNQGDSSFLAVEPGSGSTIMAYAGICNNNLQNNSDPYFHSLNFDQIVTYTTTGTGYAVAQKTPTGNNAPTVNAGGNWTIPARTPFELTAIASDPDGNPLTYGWEQRDGGGVITVGTDPGFGPIARSWNPSTSATRTFPRLSNLLANTTAFGEILPQTTRGMNMVVQVRDGLGGVNTANMFLNVLNTGAPFAVTNPNFIGQSFNGGSMLNVTWNVAGTTGPGINTSQVNIKLSTDGGMTYPITLAGATANDGAESVQLPFNLGTTTARLRVEAVGNIFFDISNYNFTIVNTPSVPAVNSGTFTWDGFTLPAAPHRIRYVFDQMGVENSVDPTDLVLLHNGNPVDNVNFLVTPDAGTNSATFTFPGFANGVLPDGNYQARLLASGVTNPGGQPLASDYVFDFFVLAGDANHDGTVNLADFNILAGNFGQSGRIFSQGDFNYSGTVDLVDFNILANRFGTSLGPDGELVRVGGQALPALPFGTREITAFGDKPSSDDELEALV